MRKKLIIAHIFLVLSIINVQSQSGFISFGGNYTGSGGSESFSCGQVFYNSNLSKSGSETQGLQHPFEFILLNGVIDVTSQIKVYPNPVMDNICIDISSIFQTEEFEYNIFYVDGILCRKEKIQLPKIYLYMSDLSSGTYFLKIKSSKSQLNNIFRIIKL